MGLYLFETSAEFLTFAPTDSNGVPIGSGEYECPLGRVQAAHVRAIYNEPTAELPDRLSVGVKRYIVMRRALADTLIKDHRLPSDLSATPVVVLSKSGKRRLSDDFVLLHSDEEYDILDHGNAEYIAVHRGEHVEIVVSVTKWSARAAAIPPLDMFPALPNDWMVSEEVKATFERCRVTGVKLTKVNIV
jgi:hypothetical protein